MEKDKDYLTPQELADRWSISRVWLYTLKSRGEVPRYRTGLGKLPRVQFPIDEVIIFEQKHFNLKG